ncbi:MAG TPA: hypothetical protein VFB27_09610 [Opitutaceae bacterium]|nr:hypothetical protein [Opitutaceae bacterium]
MKTRLILLITFFCLPGLATAASTANRWETLEAIHWVENPHNSTRMGPHGELGPYQFRQATWRMYSHRPFYQAINRQYSDEVAVKHYEWLKGGLIQAGVSPTPYNIALAWNAGLDAVIGRRIPSASRSYAEQVSNLAEHIKSNEVVSSGQVASASQ